MKTPNAGDFDVLHSRKILAADLRFSFNCSVLASSERHKNAALRGCREGNKFDADGVKETRREATNFCALRGAAA